MGIQPLCHFGFKKISEYAHWALWSFSILKNCAGREMGDYAIFGLEKTPSMCIWLFRHFLSWEIVFDGHTAAMPLWVQKNIQVCALGFMVVFYFEKLCWTRNRRQHPFG